MSALHLPHPDGLVVELAIAGLLLVSPTLMFLPVAVTMLAVIAVAVGWLTWQLIEGAR